MKKLLMMAILSLTMTVGAQAQEEAISMPFEYEFDNVDSMDGWTLYGGQLTDEGVTLTEDEGHWRLRKGYFGGYVVRYMPEDEESFSWLMTPVVDLGSNPTAEVELKARVMLDEEIDADYFRLHFVVVPEDAVPTRENIVATLEADDMPEVDETVDFSAKFSGFSGRVRIAFYAEGEGEWLPWLTIETLSAQQMTSTGIDGIARLNPTAAAVYSLGGQQLSRPSRGIVVERRADGRIMKRLSR